MNKNMEQVEIINNAEMGTIRYNELLFVDGKILQREVNGAGVTRFVDVTEEVAKAIADYIRP
jgi:hypothetical protein